MNHHEAKGKHFNKNHSPFANFHTWVYFWPNPTTIGKDRSPGGRIVQQDVKTTYNDSFQFFPISPQSLTWKSIHWEKRTSKPSKGCFYRIQVDLDIQGFEVSLWFPLRVGGFRGQVIYGMVAQNLTPSGFSGSMDQLMVILLVPKCIIWMDILGSG